jgi:hypothetical protein
MFFLKKSTLSKRGGAMNINSPIVDKTTKEIIEDYFKNTSKRCHIAIYAPFTNARNSELEMIKRLENICNKHNIGVFILYNNNIIQNTELIGIHIDEIDTSHILFCLSLHFCSPKTTNHFTLLALWNPIQFYSQEALEDAYKMDGYLSAHSDYVDNFIKSKSNKPFFGYLNTSTNGPILDLTFDSSRNFALASSVSGTYGDLDSPELVERYEYKCFYAGMNWKISEDSIRNRIYSLIKYLDDSPILSCYGLTECWKQYKSYRGEIPFDGTSIIDKIRQCGICLVLSSSLHIDEGICSCRIFEGLAAGVPIIADKNPFFEKWFSDNLFYIDTEDAVVAAGQIYDYIDYFKSNPEETMAKMENCRRIFLENFLLDRQLLEVINNVQKFRT